LNNYPPDFTARLGKANPMHRMGTTWDIAEAVMYLAAESGRFVTGELLQVDGGMQLWGTNWPLGVPDYYKVY
jgi:citronellol/citronellal dehydrogenase